VLYVFLVLAHDRRRILHFAFGSDFTRQVKELGIQEVLGALRAPQQRAYIERVIGTIRRECQDHVIIFNEASLPESRSVQQRETGRVVAVPQVGGLPHRYERRAA
jgi:transposase InsO family protein